MKIRSVRPEFFADPTMAELAPLVRLLYIGLWCFVDDYGRGEWLPKQIDGQIFPLETVDIHALLAQLVSAARIVRYSDGDRDFFHIPTFDEYQKPNRKWDSKLPDPAECTELPGQSALALSEQRVSSTFAPLGDGVGVGDGAAATNPPPEDFYVFHKERAAAEVQNRIQRGQRILNPPGLQRTISADPEFIEESHRLYAHRDCEMCRGNGFTEAYAPGAGTRRIVCEVSP
jgi:hypothetical protein